jgi:hypothetical protein
MARSAPETPATTDHGLRGTLGQAVEFDLVGAAAVLLLPGLLA